MLSSLRRQGLLRDEDEAEFRDGSRMRKLKLLSVAALEPLIENDDEARRLADARRLAVRVSSDGSLLEELLLEMMNRE